ncbi:hypothetical protein GGTG_08675 [Gaeumannomyces tritici R3-111a-1]|uniref:Uncharacterized protein n=1 Tax=Gaeumannomyces tritici (strain R3-111a-1) TaxID=644352 RepID=J3P586_GAET3|nr:hypothetical protein GGTG_08675 [Gaeumannomyces tritici R3-111a-1]EJT74837.1 hypothetical protein GGTG_08675 [Gaeumannomyces tritici R3-111a-1]
MPKRNARKKHHCPKCQKTNKSASRRDHCPKHQWSCADGHDEFVQLKTEPCRMCQRKYNG